MFILLLSNLKCQLVASYNIFHIILIHQIDGCGICIMLRVSMQGERNCPISATFCTIVGKTAHWYTTPRSVSAPSLSYLCTVKKKKKLFVCNCSQEVFFQ